MGHEVYRRRQFALRAMPYRHFFVLLLVAFGLLLLLSFDPSAGLPQTTLDVNAVENPVGSIVTGIVTGDTDLLRICGLGNAMWIAVRGTTRILTRATIINRFHFCRPI